MTSADPNAALSPVLIALMKGVTYQENDPQLWQSLLGLQARVREYVGVLGLELILDEAEGYAYLRQRPASDDASALPRLVSRRPLAFPVSLLLALLRKKLAEFDAQGGDTRLMLTRAQIVEMLRVFLPETSNEARLVDQIDAHIGKAADLGFLRPVKNAEQLYEVRRILKAYIDGQWLADFSGRLAEYARLAAGDEGEQ